MVRSRPSSPAASTTHAAENWPRPGVVGYDGVDRRVVDTVSNRTVLLGDKDGVAASECYGRHRQPVRDVAARLRAAGFTINDEKSSVECTCTARPSIFCEKGSRFGLSCPKLRQHFCFLSRHQVVCNVFPGMRHQLSLRCLPVVHTGLSLSACRTRLGPKATPDLYFAFQVSPSGLGSMPDVFLLSPPRPVSP